MVYGFRCRCGASLLIHVGGGRLRRNGESLRETAHRSNDTTLETRLLLGQNFSHETFSSHGLCQPLYCRESQRPLHQCINWGFPAVHEFTDTAPHGVAREIDGGVDVAPNAAKILGRLSTHRIELFEQHNFELLCRWNAGEWGLRTILQGTL